ncbi:13133_t:CDS:2, partial [Dentiscutata heterogama]
MSINPREKLSSIHEELLSAEHQIKNRSLPDLCKIIDYLPRIESRIYLIQYYSIEAAENAFKKKQVQNNAYQVFSNLQRSRIKEICSNANYFLGCCYENGVGCDKNDRLALFHFDLAGKAAIDAGEINFTNFTNSDEIISPHFTTFYQHLYSELVMLWIGAQPELYWAQPGELPAPKRPATNQRHQTTTLKRLLRKS